MRDEHIINLIESGPLHSLKESERIAIETHTGRCPDCLKAFQAAQVASLLLKEHAAEVFEPSPFFQTRVMATLRERQANAWGQSWAFGRLWRSAGALASTMVATVAALAVLTVVIPGEVNSGSQWSSLSNGYSAEEVLLDQATVFDEQVSDAQLLTTIYSEE